MPPAWSGQLRSKRNLTRLMQYSAQLYGKLEAETGQATEWKPVGSLRLASSEERWSELKRMATTARSFDFELHTLSPKEAQEKFPLITIRRASSARCSCPTTARSSRPA